MATKKVTTGQYTINDLSDIFELVLSRDTMIVPCTPEGDQKSEQQLGISCEILVRSQSSTTYEEGWTFTVKNENDFKEDGKWNAVQYTPNREKQDRMTLTLNWILPSSLGYKSEDTMQFEIYATKNRQQPLNGIINIVKAKDGEKGMNVATAYLYRRDKETPKRFEETVSLAKSGILTYDFKEVGGFTEESVIANMPVERAKIEINTDVVPPEEPPVFESAAEREAKDAYIVDEHGNKLYYFYKKDDDFIALKEGNPEKEDEYKVGDYVVDKVSKIGPIYEIGKRYYWNTKIPNYSDDTIWITTTSVVSKEDRIDVYPGTSENPTWNEPTIFTVSTVNSYSVIVYKRFSDEFVETTPSKPPAAKFYFENHKLEWTDEKEGDDWSDICPDYDGKPIYQSSFLATAVGSAGTCVILQDNWEEPKKFVKDGESFTIAKTDTDIMKYPLQNWKYLTDNFYKEIKPGKPIEYAIFKPDDPNDKNYPKIMDGEVYETNFEIGKIYYKKAGDVYEQLIDGKDYNHGDYIADFIREKYPVYDPYRRWYNITNYSGMKIGDSIGIEGIISDNNNSGIICVASISSITKYDYTIINLEEDDTRYFEAGKDYYKYTSTSTKPVKMVDNPLEHYNKDNPDCILYIAGEDLIPVVPAISDNKYRTSCIYKWLNTDDKPTENYYGKVRTLAFTQLIYGESSRFYWTENSTNILNRNKAEYMKTPSEDTVIDFTPSSVTFNAKMAVGNTENAKNLSEGFIQLEFLANDGGVDRSIEIELTDTKHSVILDLKEKPADENEVADLYLRKIISNVKIAKLSTINVIIKEKNKETGLSGNSLNLSTISITDLDVVYSDDVSYAYGVNDTTLPTSWSSTIPVYTEKKYLWKRNIRKYTVTSDEYTYTTTYHPERTVEILPQQQFFKANSRGVVYEEQVMKFESKITGSEPSFYTLTWNNNYNHVPATTDNYSFVITADTATVHAPDTIIVTLVATFKDPNYPDDRTKDVIKPQPPLEFKLNKSRDVEVINVFCGLTTPIEPFGGYADGDAYLNTSEMRADMTHTIPCVWLNEEWVNITGTLLRDNPDHKYYGPAMKLCEPTYQSMGVIAADENNGEPSGFDSAWYEFYKGLFLKSEWAENIYGGTKGSVPYQSNVNSTSFIAPPTTANQMLGFNTTTGIPEWKTVTSSDEKVKSESISNGTYPILLKKVNTSYTTTDTAYFSTGVTINTANSTITATKFAGKATSAGTADSADKLNSDAGSGTNPIYFSSGIPVASSSTVGSSTKPVYLSGGTLTEISGSAGSGTNPVYLSSGAITASSSTVGSKNYAIYMDAGTLKKCTNLYAEYAEESDYATWAQKIGTASGGTSCGSSTTPIYLSNGVFKEGTSGGGGFDPSSDIIGGGSNPRTSSPSFALTKLSVGQMGVAVFSSYGPAKWSINGSGSYEICIMGSNSYHQNTNGAVSYWNDVSAGSVFTTLGESGSSLYGWVAIYWRLS